MLGAEGTSRLSITCPGQIAEADAAGSCDAAAVLCAVLYRGLEAPRCLQPEQCCGRGKSGQRSEVSSVRELPREADCHRDWPHSVATDSDRQCVLCIHLQNNVSEKNIGCGHLVTWTLPLCVIEE